MTKRNVHEKAIEYVACNLIENGITTKKGPGDGVDLILNSEKTILVRGMSNEIALALMNGSLDTLKSDYIIIVTNLQSDHGYLPRIYIMTTEDAKRISDNKPYKSDGRNNWFVRVGDYRYYQEEYNILMK